jgi:oligopeptide transport system substrate-binding protein
MNKWILSSFVFILLAASCTNDNYTTTTANDGEITVFKMAMDQHMQTTASRDVVDYYTALVINQVAEGLVKLNPKTLEVEPSLAESWEVNDNGLSYTFHLRKDAYFHDHSCFKNGKGRLFTAEDVKFTFELLCKQYPNGNSSHGYSAVLKEDLLGAREFYENEADVIQGIQIIDEHTVRITFKHKDYYFLEKLSQTNFHIVAKEIIECNKEADLIGTGPFKFVSESNEGTPHIKLAKNQAYYLKDEQGVQLPYLDTVIIYVENNHLEQLEQFQAGKLHFIQNIPPSKVVEIVEGRIDDFSGENPLMKLSNDPLFGTQYYVLNTQSPALKDKRVRQALNYAINKDKIVNKVLRNNPQIGVYGIVPPIQRLLPGYDFEDVAKSGYSYDPEKARKLLAEAGYPNGKGFPSLTIKFNTGTYHSAVADEFRKQILKELNININLEGMSFEERLKDESMGKGDIFRAAWVGDYIGADNFLVNFYGKNVPADPSMPSETNTSRFQNAAFDKLFEEAQIERTEEKRNHLFSQAEKIMLEEAPIIALWYNEQFVLQYNTIRNLETNATLHLDLTRVKIKEWTIEELAERSKKIK